MDSIEPLLQRPLYIFDLPPELLEGLRLKSDQSTSLVSDPAISQTVPLDASHTNTNPETLGQQLETSKATSCSLCHLTFANVEEQRIHVKSDHHSYNVKQKLKGLTPVTENQFETLIANLDESISGSDSETASEDAATKEDSVLSNLLKRQVNLSQMDADPMQTPTANQPMVWFAASGLPTNISLGVYRATFCPHHVEHFVDALKSKQLEPVTQLSRKDMNQAQNACQTGPTWFLCMIGGGHFAAMVVSLVSKLVNTHKGGGERQAILLAHKTFHRYTTRRKQGGSQSTSDAAKGAAHSAGSSLRRANEAMLTADIRSLLTEWKSLIDSCELIFIRATGSHNRRTLFGPYEGQALRINDARNRRFPFTTRRATQSELIRCFTELTRVKISQVDEAALAAQLAARLAPAKKSAPKKPVPSKPRKAETEEKVLHSNQIANLIKRSKVPALLSYLSSNKIDLNAFILEPAQQYHHTPTTLHVASSLGIVPVITALLTKSGADPTLLNEDAKTAYDIAKDRSARDAFRQARLLLGESVCDWQAAHVGTPLTAEQVTSRDASEKLAAEQEEEREAERRKAETERLRQEEKKKEDKERSKRVGQARTLGQMTGADRREIESRGMTPEMRTRLERERRARAAEERFRRMQQPQQ